MANTKEQKILESLPWYKNCKIVEEYSHTGVACFLDAFPVTEGHMLFVPIDKKRNVDLCLNRAYRIGEEKVAADEWDGYNIGFNRGAAAGQTVKWPHVHLIPRNDGDCKDPKGGVRGVIPNRQNWRKATHYKKQRQELGIE